MLTIRALQKILRIRYISNSVKLKRTLEYQENKLEKIRQTGSFAMLLTNALVNPL